MKGKHIIITGATSGIGRELTLNLAGMGAKLSVCGRSSDKMSKLFDNEAISESNCFAEVFDITSESAIIGFVQKAIEMHNIPDILINNAGANTAKGLIEEIHTHDLDYMYAINMRAPFIFMREVYKAMKTLGEGKVVNILSSACLFANERMASYSGSKAGFQAMSDIFRKEAHKNGINVFAVYPGGTDTDFRTVKRPDYMKAESVAETIIANLLVPADVMMHELVFRPQVEDNF